MALTRSQVASYVERFRSTRVWVLGDVMLDRYVWGSVDRISPEAPVPVVRVNRRSARLGGAANVAANLSALGVHVDVAGVVGDDAAGDALMTLLDQMEISRTHVLVEPGRETTEKMRIIAQSQQVVRTDFEVDRPVGGDHAERLLGGLQAAAGESDALVVSDYGKGVIRHETLGHIIRAWREHGKPVLVDPHIGHFGWYRGASIMTPNMKEASTYYGAALAHEEFFARAGFRMRGELELGALLVTRGEDGMSLFLEDNKRIDIPAVATDVYDVTGAGDTVIGVLAAGLAAGAPLLDAVVMANRAAGEAVREIGTSTVTGGWLIAAFEES